MTVIKPTNTLLSKIAAIKGHLCTTISSKSKADYYFYLISSSPPSNSLSF